MAKQDAGCSVTPFKTSCGGQALMEGIMMQGPEKRSIVVRKPDGELDITTYDIKPRKPLWKLPFLRGIMTFGTAMVTGVKALMYSAEVSDDGTLEEEELTGLDKWLMDRFSSEKATSIIVTVAAVLSVAMSVGLFILLPTALTGLVEDHAPVVPFGAGGRAQGGHLFVLSHSGVQNEGNPPGVFLSRGGA